MLAGLALLDALLPLARTGRPPGGAGGSVVLLGAVAAACVLFRMVDPPDPAGGILSLSLREGAWLALLGSLAMRRAAAVWPRRACVRRRHRVRCRRRSSAWSGLSGWTPES